VTTASSMAVTTSGFFTTPTLAARVTADQVARHGYDFLPQKRPIRNVPAGVQCLEWFKGKQCNVMHSFSFTPSKIQNTEWWCRKCAARARQHRTPLGQKALKQKLEIMDNKIGSMIKDRASLNLHIIEE